MKKKNREEKSFPRDNTIKQVLSRGKLFCWDKIFKIKKKVDMKSAHDDLDDLLAMVMDDEPPSSKISKDNDQKFDSISPTKEPSPSPSPLKVPNVPLKEKKEKKSSASDRRPSFEDVGLGLSPKKRKEQEERLSEQRRKSEEKKAKEENYQISPYGPVTDAVLKAYSIINGTCLYWMSPASGGLSHIVNFLIFSKNEKTCTGKMFSSRQHLF